MSKKRKIAFVTTARSDYNTMYPVMLAAQMDVEVESFNFCAAMHLEERFGNTWRQLERDGIDISNKIPFSFEEDSAAGLSHSLARGCASFTDALEARQPDIVCVSGDRIENLSLFTAATAMRIPIAHMCGGDITEGAFDNQVRHAMTKLSQIHFASMPDHARRIVQMGEEPWRVTLTGDAAIDVVVNIDFLSRKQIAELIDLPEDQEFCLSTFHPQTLGDEPAVEQYENLLLELEQTSVRPIMIYPNIDPGYEELMELLEAFQARRPDAIIRHSFDRQLFYSLMKHAHFMVGNSSSGIWEAPSFELPAINIGNRQAGRLRGRNVIDVDGLSTEALSKAFSKAQSADFRAQLRGMTNPYGDGDAAQKILKVLKEVALDSRLMVKKFFEVNNLGIDDKRLGLD